MRKRFQHKQKRDMNEKRDSAASAIPLIVMEYVEWNEIRLVLCDEKVFSRFDCLINHHPHDYVINGLRSRESLFTSSSSSPAPPRLLIINIYITM